MKRTFLIGVSLLFLCSIRSQDRESDSLKKCLIVAEEDTTAFNLQLLISFNNLFSYPDTALLYARNALLLAKKLREPAKEAEALFVSGTALSVTGNYPLAIDYLLKGSHIEEQFNSLRITKVSYGLPMLRIFYYNLLEAYNDQGDYEHALFYINKAKLTGIKSLDDQMEKYLHLSMIYERSNQLDSALLNAQKAYDLDIEINGKNKREYIAIVLGNVHFKKRNYPLALDYYRIARSNPQFIYTHKDAIEVYNGMASTFAQIGNIDSATHYAQMALDLRDLTSYPLGTLSTFSILSGIYKKQGKLDSTVKYLEQTASLRDTLFSKQKEKEVQNLSFIEKLRGQEEIAEQERYRTKMKIYGALAIVVLLLTATLLMWHNILHKKKAYTMLRMQKDETDSQKQNVEKALAKLKATQAQLIQSEKMASLGELTAGIAHEIQNPLNFVNNFSEVNKELIEELKGERSKAEGERNTEFEDQLLNDIKSNEEKIILHGKRADSIVKGMLQHSRTTQGQKESIDINALANEYLNLSYHAMRAKDKTFNAVLQTNFDKNVDRISIIPTDMGRVLLNLYNNAFHSMIVKSKSNDSGYEAKIFVATKLVDHKVIITVKDNGVGISSKIKDKIFQPFFTTKPAGQGTGLGLSLSYDIITNEHGGEIKVESTEGEGAEFIIQLPL